MFQTIRQKVLVVGGVMLAFAIMQVLAVLLQGQAIQRDAQDISSRVMPVVHKVYDLRIAVIQVQQWLTDVSATRGLDGLDDGFGQADEYAKRFVATVNELAALQPQNADRYRALLPIFNDYYQTGRVMAKAYVEGGPEQGNAMMEGFDGVAEKLSTALDPLLAENDSDAMALIKGQEAGIGDLNFTAVGFSLGSVGLMLLLIQVIKPLNRVVSMVKDIAAGEGDLTKRLDESAKDELGQLAHWFNRFTENLQGVVKDIGASVHALTSKAEELAVVAEHTSERIRIQHAETDQVATAMNEMSATVSEVASHATNAAGSAMEADREATRGKRVVASAVDSINGLAAEVEKAAGVIHRLEENSENIGKVLDVIKAIAEQTNLLALNAAIEAARAGEQGRGFAVVADEVRTLAQRTQNSTAEIQNIIESLQVEAQAAVKVMEEGRNQAQSSVEQAGKAGASLETITEAVAKINDMNNLIASAAEEQSAAAEEINRNINNISGVANETADSARQTVSGSLQIAEQADQLRSLVERFKV